jgi:hypothetical protein
MMRLLRRLFPLTIVLCLLAGAIHTVMTGTLADALIQGSIRDALAAGTVGGAQEPVQEARRYLGLHEAAIAWLRFLAPNPDTSGIDTLRLKLEALDLFAEVVGPMKRPPQDSGMQFVTVQLGELQTVSAGVWKPWQRRTSAAIFWSLFALAAIGGVSRLRQPAAPSPQAESEPAKDGDP